MRKLRLLWRSVCDLRPGEGVRTRFMALQLMFVLCAYYAVCAHPYVLIAMAGGMLAYVVSGVHGRVASCAMLG